MVPRIQEPFVALNLSKLRSMKILIIGSEGFIGKHCSTYFRQIGHTLFEADVASITKPNYFIIAKTNSSFNELFASQQFDICINASGSAHVGFSFEKPDIDFELNVMNVHKLLVAIRTYNPLCKFINFSSAAVYGNPESLPIKEEAAKNPLSPYGFHKLQSEFLLKEYHRFFNIATCNLRIFSAYGPGLRKQLFWDLFQKSKQQENIKLFGTGEESRDFIYIDDLLEALQYIINQAPFDGESYNIASGKEIKIKEVAETFFTKLNPNLRYQFSGEQKIGDPDNWVADISKLKALGFKPKHSLSSGLEETVQWITSEA
jgi:dTDP-glucose 4,6-dehydratase/UDP-glucose 4-epimerase